MAVTGKSEGGGDGERVVDSIRRTSDVPALIGIGIATATQAQEAASVSDGVIVGSALVQVVLDGGGAAEIESFIREFRRAIDAS
jgi:tryptophan synthase alpha chain